jgi:uncharacterized hydrophobic protein (TIGR00271 family)
MSNHSPKGDSSFLVKIFHLRLWLANHLGISTTRKTDIYLELCESVTLYDLSYWLQVLFAAGIATLGLALNSPAVIIGAMLISPLMGGILANGLALATGDVILAVRATINLILSCGLSILFAVFLVFILPFKEMTHEILVRTQPTILDLTVALFSGAVGSIALCKESKGIATSIPGVAIAVALMPPLCVVGYGIGTMFSFDRSSGFQVARGGGLLFFTNLVAIVFMAMIIFLGLHLDNKAVRQKVREWRAEDPESLIVQHWLERLPAFEYIKKIGGLPGRFLLILVTILLISFPLTQSLIQLRQQITQKQKENRIRVAVTETWQKEMEKFSNSESRSYINHLSLLENKDKKLKINLQVVTSQLYSEKEQKRYLDFLAKRLKRNPDTINFQLVEIPTGKFIEEQASPLAPPSIADLQSAFLREVSADLRSLSLPAPAQMINYEIQTSAIDPLNIELIYLSYREIQTDAQSLITQNIRDRLVYPQAKVSFRRIDPNKGQLIFTETQIDLNAEQKKILDQAGQLLSYYPNLQLEMITYLSSTEKQTTLDSTRSPLIRDYLVNQWKIDAERLFLFTEEQKKPQTTIQLKLSVNSTKSRS